MEAIRNDFTIDSKIKAEIESFIKDLVEKYIQEISTLINVESYLNELAQEVSNCIRPISSLVTDQF